MAAVALDAGHLAQGLQKEQNEEANETLCSVHVSATPPPLKQLHICIISLRC